MPVPLLLIPGIQGRWEYLRPTVDALARWFGVLTFALCGERRSGMRFDPARGLDNYVAQALAVLDAHGVDRAVVCGVSFGGLVAVRFAATHPERTIALVLASAPGPRPTLARRHQLYARAPWLFGPLFLLESPRRLRPELVATFPRGRVRRRFALEQLRTLLGAPISLRRMGARARIMSTLDLTDDCARITAPTLIVTGEPGLDHVVPVDGSSAYARLIHGARSVVLERTGHLGVVTRADAFATLVGDFLLTIEQREGQHRGRRSSGAA